MAQRWNYVPDYAAAIQLLPRIRTARFGDGYEQRSGDGINTLLQGWSVKFGNRKKADALEMEAFLEAHAGTTAFDFPAPEQSWTVSDSGIGAGDGALRVQFSLVRPTQTARNLDWRGAWPVYTKPRTNYLPFSENFAGAAWTLTNVGTGVAPVIVSGYAMGPDGNLSASRLDLNKGAGNTTADLSGVQQASSSIKDLFRPGDSLTFSIWLRTVDSSTKAIAIRAHSSASAEAVVSVTGTWTRFSQTFTLATVIGVQTMAMVRLIGGSGTDQTASLLAFGAQIEKATAATRYIQTPSSAAVTETPSYGPAESFAPATGWTTRPTIYRQDWRGRQALYDSKRSNLFQYAEDLSNAYWAKTNTTITTGTGVAPRQSNLGNKIAETATTAVHSVSRASPTGISPNRVTCFSGYFQSAERSQVYLELTTFAGGTAFAYFDLSSGTVLTSGGGVTAAISNAASGQSANGWWRCSVAVDLGSGGGTVTAKAAVANGGTNNYAGSAGSGIRAWGIQLEEDTTAPRPLILTGATAITQADYTLSATGLVTLTETPDSGAQISFDASGEQLRRVICRKWSLSPINPDNYDVSAEFEEVMS